MRELINRIRAFRDDSRRALSRRLYDRPMPAVEQVRDIRRIVFVRWDAKWGDSVIFSFMCRELRKLGPISIEVITTRDMASLFRDHLGVDVVHESRKRPSRREIRALASKIGRVDLAVHFSTLLSSRSIYLLHCLDARYRSGLDDTVGLIDLKLGQATAGLHMEDKYCELLKRCGVSQPDKRYIVPREEKSEAAVAAFLAVRPRPFVTINPFSKGRAKTLAPLTTLRLIEMLCERLPDHDICLLTAPGWDREIEAITAGWPKSRCFFFPDTRSIYDNIALLARADGLVSGSTATVHLADGLAVPSMVLFVPTPVDVIHWGSVHPGSVNLMAEPGVPIDVNRLDWTLVERELHAFTTALGDPAQPR
ncbi:glycosyltransferase family 9 protein [Billgrantia sp. Q4P2]|uniref:glycosyltransferase family 9 protein n=1 Tax=Billgrantia sp. Q4P2 TaxID=3463857 RepID=UPI004055B640